MSIVHADVLAARERLAREFREARPFRHVVVDGFLDPAFARRILADFPSFEAKYALNEMGQVGGKAVRMDVRDISDAYRALDAHIQTPAFLDLVSSITGIPGLMYDPDYVGGGTHENVHGQGLDPHVDFNYHPRDRSHRRLNLIVYLNHEWDAAWGGALELHSDPWDAKGNTIERVLPLFNRCVIFETNEISWHGFQRIVLPEERRGLSRKSFAIYLYTRERPAAEAAPSHATIYVPDVRPDDVAEGTTLSAAQVRDLDQRFDHLRGQLKFLYEREKHFNAQIGALERALDEARGAFKVDLQGYAVQTRAATGFWPDGWAAAAASFAFAPTRRVKGLELDVWVPKQLDGAQELRIAVGGSVTTESLRPGSRRTLRVALSLGSGDAAEVRIEASRSWTPKASGESEDARPLAFKLVAASLEH